MATICGKRKIFENCKEYIAQIPCGSKISIKSLYLTRLRRQKQICVLPFLGKIRKFKMAAIFGEGKFFLKIAKSAFLRHPVGRKFRRNRSISHGYGDRSKFVFCHFWQKFENSKWPPFLRRGKFFENCQEYIPYIPCGSKISMKSLYLARLRR